MPWIRTIAPEAATGLLRTLYDEAVARAGKVFHILSLQSLRPKALRHSVALYQELMLSNEGALTRAQREAIATAVSRANECEY